MPGYDPWHEGNLPKPVIYQLPITATDARAVLHPEKHRCNAHTFRELSQRDRHIDLYKAAGRLVLDANQQATLGTMIVPGIIANWVSHYETGSGSSLDAYVLLDVLKAIDDFAHHFKYDCSCKQQPGKTIRKYYRSLSSKGLQRPPEIVAQIVDTLGEDRKHEESKLSAEQTRLDSRLTLIRNRMDAAYADKLDGKIPEDFWDRKMSEWRAEE